jgi:hypothetical protein
MNAEADDCPHSRGANMEQSWRNNAFFVNSVLCSIHFSLFASLSLSHGGI